MESSKSLYPDGVGSISHDLSNELFVKENKDIQKILIPMSPEHLSNFYNYRNPSEEFRVAKIFKIQAFKKNDNN